MPDHQNSDHCRSVLYVPAANSRALAKISNIQCDWIIVDLEDSVAVEAKQLARDQVVDWHGAMNFDSRKWAIRLGASGGERFFGDLEFALSLTPTAVVLPKVDHVGAIYQAAERIMTQQKDDIELWAMIETPQGLVNIADIAGSSADKKNLTTLVAGTNDLAKATGIDVDDYDVLAPWMMQLVLHAKANSLRVLDGVYNRFSDLDGLRDQCLSAKRMGFDGKTLIHPAQIPVVEAIFKVSSEQVARARAIVSAFEHPQNRELGVINLDGEMVERLHLEAAQNLLRYYDGEG